MQATMSNARGIGRPLHRVAVVALALTAVQAFSANAARPVLEEFHRFLTNRPPIKRVELSVSLNRWGPSKLVNIEDVRRRIQKPPPPPFVPVIGAIQPNGFFLKFPTGERYGVPIIFGESASAYWNIDPLGVNHAPKDGLPGASPENNSAILSQWHRRDLDQFLLLGIEDAAAGSITFETATEFKARSATAADSTLRGRLELDATGRPVGFKYESTVRIGPHDEIRPVRVEGHYFYNEDRLFPPFGVVLRRQVGNDPPQFLTNYVERLEIGIDETATNGFHPSEFIAPADPPREVHVWSNGLRYRVLASGVRVLDMGVPPPPDLLVQPGSHQAKGRFFVAAGVVIAAVSCVWWLARRKRQNRV